MIAIQIKLNANLYLRDPQETKLGKKIIQYSIIFMNQLGFENFTFKKLAQHIDSTEASIYRYFKNKQQLLLYLISWYWEWMRYQIDYNIMNIIDLDTRLQIAIAVLVESFKKKSAIEYIDERLLHKIVVAESSKVFCIKNYDLKNKEEYFVNYKNLCTCISTIILEKNPNYPYPIGLVSSLIEMANSYFYRIEYLPGLTDFKLADDNLDAIKGMLEQLAFASINSISQDYFHIDQ